MEPGPASLYIGRLRGISNWATRAALGPGPRIYLALLDLIIRPCIVVEAGAEHLLLMLIILSFLEASQLIF